MNVHILTELFYTSKNTGGLILLACTV
uniref:Uncharacterized protein n=1 Tax=Anguilla anguilla TaxID=7936 RepID=A0A0E9UIH9_ANGAN